MHSAADHHPGQALVDQAVVIDAQPDIVAAVVIAQPHLGDLLTIRRVGIGVDKALVVAHGQRTWIDLETHAVAAFGGRLFDRLT